MKPTSWSSRFSVRIQPNGAARNTLKRELQRVLCMVAIVATVAIGAWIRSVRMNDPLWVDELHTSWTVSADLADVASRAAQGNQSPLFFWIEWFVQSAFGHSETALRAVSWLSGLMLVVVSIFVSLGMTRSRAAACAIGLLIAIDGNLTFYANEARPYALLQLLGMLSALACFHYATTGTARSRFAWIGLAAVSCYLHYTAALLMVGEAIYLVARSLIDRTHQKISFRQVCVDLLIIALLLSPSLSHLQAIAERRANWAQFIGKRDWSAFVSVFPTTLFMFFAFAVAAFVVAVAVARKKTRADQVARLRSAAPFIAFTLCWFLVPTLIAYVLNNSDVARVFIRRYLVAIIPATYLLTASFVSLPTSRWLRLVVAVVVVAFGVSRSPLVRFEAPCVVVPRHANEDWRAAIAHLNSITRPKMVLMRAGLIEDDYLKQDRLRDDWNTYSQLPINGIYRLNRESTSVISLPYTDAGSLDEHAVDLLSNRNEAWLMLRGHLEARESIMTTAMKATKDRFVIDSSQSFGPTLGVYHVVEREHR